MALLQIDTLLIGTVKQLQNVFDKLISPGRSYVRNAVVTLENIEL